MSPSEPKDENLSTLSKPADCYTAKKYPWRLRVTPFADIVQNDYDGSGTEEDPYIVDWLFKDPGDPQNW